jgi:hypothetical protein
MNVSRVLDYDKKGKIVMKKEKDITISYIFINQLKISSKMLVRQNALILT